MIFNWQIWFENSEFYTNKNQMICHNGEPGYLSRYRDLTMDWTIRGSITCTGKIMFHFSNMFIRTKAHPASS
jgi:hypothetical protein